MRGEFVFGTCRTNQRTSMFGPSCLHRPRGRRLTRSIYGLLAERELHHFRDGLEIEMLRWAAVQWGRQPIVSSEYCKLNAEAKSTIALAFSGDGSLFASTHGDHTVKVKSALRQIFLPTHRHFSLGSAN